MYGVMMLNTLCATAFAAPLTQSSQISADTNSTWRSAEGTLTLCDKTSDKTIGFYVGPQMESVLAEAYAAMMPTCAYSDRLADDTVCIQTRDWRLDGPKSSLQSANIQTTEGSKISGWVVEFSVTPATMPETSVGVFWTTQDYYGYFAYMLQKWEPKGCHTQQGFGIGNMKVGGRSSLAGTVFEAEIVAER